MFFAFDSIIGWCFDFLSANNKGGETGRNCYIFNNTKEDILAMGSSRCSHHYIPKIISDSTGLSCYNCGYDGNGIIMQYAVWKMVSKRYYPKYIIYDVTPGFDIYTEQDNRKYLDKLKPFYYSNPEIDSVFWSVDKKERLKMISHSYQYNSNWLAIIGDCIYPIYQAGENGFLPLYGSMKSRPKKIVIRVI